jgi:hypothetical protein
MTLVCLQFVNSVIRGSKPRITLKTTEQIKICKCYANVNYAKEVPGQELTLPTFGGHP